MRNVIFQNMITIDGYFEGPNREIDWHNVDEEFNAFATSVLDSVGALVFGRVTYQLMADYWPSPSAAADDPVIALKMNSLPKYVISGTLQKVSWPNTTLLRGNPAEEVSKLKSQNGKDLAIFGSSELALALMPKGLIDEYRIIVAPVILGDGRPLFKGTGRRYTLRLLDAKVFKSGNVLLRYHPLESQ